MTDAQPYKVHDIFNDIEFLIPGQPEFTYFTWDECDVLLGGVGIGKLKKDDRRNISLFLGVGRTKTQIPLHTKSRAVAKDKARLIVQGWSTRVEAEARTLSLFSNTEETSNGTRH